MNITIHVRTVLLGAAALLCACEDLRPAGEARAEAAATPRVAALEVVARQESKPRAYEDVASTRAAVPSADSLHARFPALAACEAESDDHFGSGLVRDIRARYRPSLQVAPLGSGGYVVGCNADYRFIIVRAGRTPVEVQRPTHRVPVSADEKASFVSAWTMRIRNERGDSEWSWRGEALPDEKPAYARIVTTSNDDIWIWPTQASQRIAAPPQWQLIGGPADLFVEPSGGSFDVFGADGRYTGAIRVPPEIGYAPLGTMWDPVVRGDTAWFAAVDTTGRRSYVQTLIRRTP